MESFYILLKTDRSRVQVDSKQGYLTLWRLQPYPSQSLNPQTEVEFEGQEVKSGCIFPQVLSLVVQKHSYMLDCQAKLLVLKHSSQTVSCAYFSKTSLVLSHRWRLVTGEVEKAPTAIRKPWRCKGSSFCRMRFEAAPYTIQP